MDVRVGLWRKLSAEEWCFWTVVLEKTLESPLDCKEIQPVHPKGDNSWVFIGRTDAEAETPILWPPDAKSWLVWKDPDAGKDWNQEEKGVTEDEMVGWHHWLDGHEFEQALGVGDGQGGLLCCSPWVHRVGHNWATELNWAELIHAYMHAYLKYSSLFQRHNWLRAVVFQLKHTVTDWAQRHKEESTSFLLNQILKRF